MVIAPPFTALERVGAALRGSEVALAAQNVNAEEEGAFTGEIAPRMLADLGCSYAIVGHSERRTLYGETNQGVAAKAAAAAGPPDAPDRLCGRISRGAGEWTDLSR